MKLFNFNRKRIEIEALRKTILDLRTQLHNANETIKKLEKAKVNNRTTKMVVKKKNK